VESSPQQESKKGARSLWIWVLVAFIVLISAWTALIVIATKNQPEIIQIETP
jgi:flagellar basal body-associated protein FliL